MFPFPCAPAGALTVATLEKPAHPAQHSTINSTGSAGKHFVLGHQICLPARGLEEGNYRASSLPSKQLGYSSGTRAANLKNKTCSANTSGKVASSSCRGHVSRSGSSRVWSARSDPSAASHLGWEKPAVC